MRWHRSINGKISLFLFASIVFAYGLGAGAGWIVMQKTVDAAWQRQARLNAQVATYAIRSIYTFVAIESNPQGEADRIVTDRPIGDEEAVLYTGYDPADVLALAAAQTRNGVWLFNHDTQSDGLTSAVKAPAEPRGMRLLLPQGVDPKAFYVGPAMIGDTEHYIAALPVVEREGALLGSLVSSIGEVDEITRRSREMALSSLYLLAGVLVVAGAGVAVMMRGLLRPLPLLMGVLTGLARDETGSVTPFQDRPDEIGRLAGAIERLREAVVEREKLRHMREVAARMEHLAHHDSLTGLPNRALFDRRLAGAVEELQNGGASFNVLLIDLDRFKAVNDSLGHGMGDRLLVAAGRRLAMLIGPRDLAARFGGDEFAVLQRASRRGAADGARLAHSVVDAFTVAFDLEGTSVSVGASVGVAAAPDHASAAEELMARADVALYRVKTAGRGGYRLYEQGMVMTSATILSAADLTAALAEEAFHLEYQPFFEAGSGRLAGFEALLRWRHPQHGLLSPDTFLSLVEHGGQSCELASFVIGRALRDAARLPQALVVAVNMSPHALGGDFVRRLSEMLDRHGVSGKRLEIEIDAAGLAADPALSAALGAIRATGARITLDRFGAARVSLDCLTGLPIDKVKSDRGLIEAASDGGKGAALFAGTIALVRGLGLEAAVAGIENEEQMRHACRAGADFIQGFHLGRPGPLIDLIAFAEDNAPVAASA